MTQAIQLNPHEADYFAQRANCDRMLDRDEAVAADIHIACVMGREDFCKYISARETRVLLIALCISIALGGILLIGYLRRKSKREEAMASTE